MEDGAAGRGAQERGADTGKWRRDQGQTRRMHRIQDRIGSR